MPKPTVAVLGASSDRSKFGNKSVRAHLHAGYDVYPVNPKGGTIEGLTAYRTLDEVPVAHLERISVYLPPAVTLSSLEAIAAKGCDELFLNPGTESHEVLERAKAYSLKAIPACSIVDLGLSPGQFP
jgi:predicted CoA-binding protein